MSWLNPSDYERELLNSAQNNRSDIVELAMYSALCPSIEPLLLRNMRHQFLNSSEPEVEHQLWFSSLISARSTLNIVLHQGVARLLANQLQETEHFDTVWHLTQQWTLHWSALDRLEQQLRVAALLNDQSLLKKGLQDVLKLITEASNNDKRLKLARWAKKTLPVIASNKHPSDETAWLSQYAATLLGATANWTELGSSALIPDWLLNSSSTANINHSSIGLQLRYDPDTGHQVLECLATEDAVMSIPLPTPLPAILYIQGEHQQSSTREVIDIGSRIKIPQVSHRIELRTINGKRYQLEAEFKVPDPSPQKTNNKLFLAYVKEDFDTAQQIAKELAQKNIELTLVQETPGDTDVTNTEDTHNKLLRLWTQTAQEQWSSINLDTLQTPINSLLLRFGQADLPTGTNPAEMIDWEKTKNHADKINHWLQNNTSESPPARDHQLLLKELENPNTQPRRRLEIGDLLAKMGDPRPGVGVKEYELIEYPDEIQTLLDELQELNTEPPRRLKIGDQLAKLGDPRSGVGVDKNGLPDIDWVEIPAGEFIYGVNKSQQTLSLEKFYISRYPITNSQYQAFIDTGSYQEERWWQDLKKPQPDKPSWSQSNRPRETADWYEAVAFTRWLSEQSEFDISLPNEQQWEKAARGTDGRIYPWGNKFQSGFANFDENKNNYGHWYLQQTTAVGSYPQGNSPYQLADMSGNVWEWCLNKYDSPNNIEIDSSDNMRVLRGGSWSFDPEVAHCAFRFRNFPDLRYNLIGFRVVCLSPYTEH